MTPRPAETQTPAFARGRAAAAAEMDAAVVAAHDRIADLEANPVSAMFYEAEKASGGHYWSNSYGELGLLRRLVELHGGP